jgi:extradiol dioxygenase family protein
MEAMEPILHLSLPVRDLAEARAFYVDLLGCQPGRQQPDWIDVWFFGLQLTLHARPDQVAGDDRAGVRHFGVTLETEQYRALIERLTAHNVRWLSESATDYAGTPEQQTKAKFVDPSGNVVELKTYAAGRAAISPQ